MLDANEKTPVSLIVVNYNAGTVLADCVKSGSKQVAEVIVVDNASSDDSLEILQSKNTNNKAISILRENMNLGFATACNIGINTAKFDYILILNPDCILESGSVARLLEELKSKIKVGMVGGLLLNPDGTEQGGGRRAVPTPWRSFVRAFGLYRLSQRWPKLFSDFHQHEQPLPEGPIEVEAISGACMLVSRKAVEDVGKMDEEYFLHCEDLDWCMRFRRKGWKILFVPDVKITHYQGTCSKSKPIFVAWQKHKGMIRFYRKFFQHQYPGILMWAVTIGVWLRFASSVLYYFIAKLLKSIGIRRG